jgi:hypothetical protein
MNQLYTVGALLVGLGALASSCNRPAEEQAAAPAPPPAAQPSAPAPAPLPQPPACPLPAYQWKALADKPVLDSLTVAALARQHPQLPEFFREYSAVYEHLRVLDTIRCAGFTLLPLLYEHEDCCEDLLYLTFTPDGRQLLDYLRPAGRGADGQWQAEATLRAEASGQLRVTTKTRNQDDEGPAYYRDVVQYAYSLTPAGRFVRTRLDSVRTTHRR